MEFALNVLDVGGAGCPLQAFAQQGNDFTIFSPTLAKIIATLLVALVLVFRPQGLFGAKA